MQTAEGGAPVNARKKLTDILLNSDREKLGLAWDSTKAAEDLKPLPPAEYRCRVASGELFNARSGNPGYKLKLVVMDGEHVDRLIWLDFWLTEAALPMTKRDLGKLGIVSLEQLERPLPDGIIVRAKVALRRDDDGTEYNRVTRLDLVDIERPEPEPFAPTNGEPGEPDARDSGGFNWSNGQQEDPPAPSRGRGAYSQP
jgi:hypothetical protein